MAQKKFKIILNDKNNLTDILNELYNESCMLLLTIQNEMNKLTNSTDLSALIMEEKADYAKAIHSYITDKNAALKLKLDISKILSEVLKYSGDEKNALANMNKKGSEFSVDTFDLKALQKSIIESKENENEIKHYQLKS